MSEWQPIETAPKSGFYLVNVPGLRRNPQVAHISGGGIMTIGDRFAFDVPEPTHWMPLPAPPTLPLHGEDE